MRGLHRIAQRLRTRIIKAVSNNGGHLASNLGVVELTVALHRVLDTPRDKLIWDVGHTCYAHKLLTGRSLRELRQWGGVSGFSRTQESTHDAFDTGHSSTSVSAALGYAVARDLNGGDATVVAVIGDGALTGGLAYEALNNAPHTRGNLIIVLNDNEMSISPNVGAIAGYLDDIRTAPFYRAAKRSVKGALGEIPLLGTRLVRGIHRVKAGVKDVLLPNWADGTQRVVTPNGGWFEDLGLVYMGPVDGHDIAALIDALHRAKRINAPVLLHVCTTKGKGYPPAEREPHRFHSVAPFNVATGQSLGNGCSNMTDAFADAVTALGDDERVVAITAAMPDGTGLSRFKARHPDRFFDVGIAEGHAVTFAAALAAGGMLPVAAIYSTFMQRAYDHILHDVCMGNYPVTLCLDRAGLSGEDGETHHGLYDVAMLCPMPNLSLLAPSTPTQLRDMLRYAVTVNKAPIALRYPKHIDGAYANVIDGIPFEFGEAAVLRRGTALTVLTYGSMTGRVLQAADTFGDDCAEIEVVDVRTLKPLDLRMINDSVSRTGRLLVVEEHTSRGGLYDMLADIQVPKRQLCLPEGFIPQGKRDVVLAHYGMDANGIATVMEQILHG